MQQNDMGITALYCRLSQEDQQLGESNSIQNQKLLLAQYAKEHGFFNTRFFIDDGVSGVSFDRQGLNLLMKLAGEGRISTVITKDLSRLGRNYLQAGQLIELYFPEHNIRYIAINDGVDTACGGDEFIALRNWFNEMYARDTSKKIRSAFQSRMKEGSYIGNFAPYGYQKDPEDKHHLIPDEEAAQVVREIFRKAEQGMRPAEIADCLNERGILPPGTYRDRKQIQADGGGHGKGCGWTSNSIGKMLGNVVYLGHMAQGKTTKLSFKSCKTIENSREQWIVVENTHMPLVSRETYSCVQRQKACRTVPKTAEGFRNLYSGIAKCGDCGHGMSTAGTRKKGAVANLVCGRYKLYGKDSCGNHFIDYEELHGIVLDAVREAVQVSEDEKQALVLRLKAELLKQENGAEGKEQKQRRRAERLRRREAELDQIIRKLYEDNLADRLNEQRFDRLLRMYEEESAVIAGEIKAIETEQKDGQEESGVQQEEVVSVEESVKKYTELICLDRELLFALVERIDVGQGYYERTGTGRVKHQTVRIYLRFGYGVGGGGLERSYHLL